MNASKTREILEGTTVSARRSRFQPDDFRKLPVPNASPAEQAQITEKVMRLLELGEEFLNLRRDGWKIKTSENKVVAPARLSKYSKIRKSPFGIGKVAWGININDATAHIASLRLKSNIFWRGKSQKAAELTNPVDESALIWLEKQFKQFPADTSFQAAEAEGAEIPMSPDEAVKALALLQNEENQILEKVKEFNRIRTEVDLLIENLYETRKILN